MWEAKSLLVEDQHAVSITLRPNTESEDCKKIGDLLTFESVPNGQVSEDRWSGTFPALHPLSCPDVCGS